MTTDTLSDRILGCLYGGAIGDALGAPAEGRTPEAISARYGAIADFVEPWDGPSPLGKGNGRYTDDTHMVQVLARIYLDHGDHLDAFSFARAVPALLFDEPRYVAEFGREMRLVDRLFYPEKWLVLRLRYANADPRTGGVGNMVNCGAAMYAAPVGIVNACDPRGAYHEAIDVFSAHQSSYGLESAGVMAACIAAALRPGATVDSVIVAALALAKEGTRAAIGAVVERARAIRGWRDAIAPLREAIRPFDGGPDVFGDHGRGDDSFLPSRRKSIEELPVALGMLAATGGDLEQSMFGGANYGRDCDSIASMAGAIAGALYGASAIRPAWIAAVNEQNHVDLRGMATGLAELARNLQRRQLAEAQERAQDFAALV